MPTTSIPFSPENMVLIPEPSLKDFVPGELYCIDDVWSFLTNSKGSIERALMLPAYTPIMFLGLDYWNAEGMKFIQYTDHQFLYMDKILNVPTPSLERDIEDLKFRLFRST